MVVHEGGADRWFVQDHLYSAAALVDAAGAVVERYEYDAYGGVRAFTSGWASVPLSQAATSLLFTGRRLDILDGGSLTVYQYRHRVYDPQTGRFLQTDPLGNLGVLCVQMGLTR